MVTLTDLMTRLPPFTKRVESLKVPQLQQHHLRPLLEKT